MKFLRFCFEDNSDEDDVTMQMVDYCLGSANVICQFLDAMENGSSLLSAIMKLFEWVIEKRLRKHLEDNGFFSKYQSGYRKSKSTNDHLFRLSQTIMESFNRGEHVIAAFLDVEKAFDNVWHNGLRYKI